METSPYLTQRLSHIGMEYTGRVTKIFNPKQVELQLESPYKGVLFCASTANLEPADNDGSVTIPPYPGLFFDIFNTLPTGAKLGDFLPGDIEYINENGETIIRNGLDTTSEIPSIIIDFNSIKNYNFDLGTCDKDAILVINSDNFIGYVACPDGKISQLALELIEAVKAEAGICQVHEEHDKVQPDDLLSSIHSTRRDFIKRVGIVAHTDSGRLSLHGGHVEGMSMVNDMAEKLQTQILREKENIFKIEARPELTYTHPEMQKLLRPKPFVNPKYQRGRNKKTW